MKKSDILKAAKADLWDGDGEQVGEEFICLAIKYGKTGRRIAPYTFIMELVAQVRGKIDNQECYENYLTTCLGRRWEGVYTTKQLQDLRHGLLDEMIAEYEAKGE